MENQDKINHVTFAYYRWTLVHTNVHFHPCLVSQTFCLYCFFLLSVCLSHLFVCLSVSASSSYTLNISKTIRHFPYTFSVVLILRRKRQHERTTLTLLQYQGQTITNSLKCYSVYNESSVISVGINLVLWIACGTAFTATPTELSFPRSRS